MKKLYFRNDWFICQDWDEFKKKVGDEVSISKLLGTDGAEGGKLLGRGESEIS